jgi:restriction endonuclease S subunit
MNKKLSGIADVIAGYAFRGAIEPDPNGNVFVAQAKDIVMGEPFDVNVLTRIKFNVINYPSYLKKNDVLIISRGMKAGAFKAAIFCSDATNVIVSSSVNIIRVKDQNILPEYVMCYLNSNDGQEALSEFISGSYIGALSRKNLEEIKIPIPPVQKQKMIFDLHKNIAQQQKVLERKARINRNISNLIFENLTIG